MVTLRPAKQEEAPLALEMIEAAKAFFRSMEIDQWQRGYPDLACLAADIACGTGYFLVEGEAVLGYVCLTLEEEPSYEELNGQWHTQKPYAVMHRLAVAANARRRGVGAAAFALTEEYAMAHGAHSVRVDTDAANKIMQHLLAKAGYTYCGTIWFDNSEKIAFDKCV